MAQPQLHEVIGQRAAQARGAQRVAKPDPAARFRRATVVGGPALSPLAQAVEQRGRRHRIFPVSNLFGVGGKAIHHIGVLLGHGSESEQALFAAHKSIAERVEKGLGADSARSDADLLAGAKVREILYQLTREAVDENRLKTTADGRRTYPAFPSPAWMAKHLGPDEEAALMHLVEEVREELRPGGALPVDDLDAIAAELDEHGAAHLAHLPRVDVTRLCVELARAVVQKGKALDAMLAGATVG